MEIEEFKEFEYTKPRKEASFNKDRSGIDLQFHKYTGTHWPYLNALVQSFQLNFALPYFYFSIGED
jgi:hypothetical protein